MNRPADPPTTTAVILAAGVGERLRPLTEDRPKALVEVAGRTILDRTIDSLVAYGVRRVIVATGYREEALREALRDVACEVDFCPNPEFATTQNMVSLALCAEAVGEAAFFKLDGDVLFTHDVLARLDASAAPLAVAVDSSRELDEEAMKVSAEAGRIRRFGKELSVEEAFAETTGIERVGPEAVGPLFAACASACREGRTDVYYEAIYEELLGPRVWAEPVDIRGLTWTEVDDHADLAVAEGLFAVRGTE
jgi:L-glutamine-phosphate cytidylyltransferase